MKSSSKLPIDVDELKPAEVRAELAGLRSDAGKASAVETPKVLSFEETIARKRAFQFSHDRTSDSDDFPEEVIPQQISRHTNAVSFILVAAECPDKHRAYVDAVIGAADGRDDWFEANDFLIGIRARAEADLVKDPEVTQTTFVKPINKATIRKWTQRARNEFNEWQKAVGFTLIEVEPGGKAGTQYAPSRYRIPVLRLAAQAFEEAQLDTRWKRDPDRALRTAAFKVLNREKASLLTAPKRDRFRRPKPTAERYRKTALTYARKFYDCFLVRGKLERGDEELRALAEAILDKRFEDSEDGDVGDVA